MAVLLSVLFCFNTQPPEGGWQAYLSCAYLHTCFNTQPPEGGWSTIAASDVDGTVSTHSRLKAAVVVIRFLGRLYAFQHTAA